MADAQEILDQIGSLIRSASGARRRGGDEGPEDASEEARAKFVQLSSADSVPESAGAEMHGARERVDRNHETNDETLRSTNRRAYDTHTAAIEQMQMSNAAEYSHLAHLRMVGAAGVSTSVPGLTSDQLLNTQIREGAALRGILQQSQSGATAIEAIRGIVPVWMHLAASRGISAEMLAELILSEAAKTSTSSK
jgi:hypothetical protein